MSYDVALVRLQTQSQIFMTELFFYTEMKHIFLKMSFFFFCSVILIQITWMSQMSKLSRQLDGPLLSHHMDSWSMFNYGSVLLCAVKATDQKKKSNRCPFEWASFLFVHTHIISLQTVFI